MIRSDSFIGQVVAFRDAFLERYPAILDQLLQKAVETEESKVSSSVLAF